MRRVTNGLLIFAPVLILILGVGPVMLDTLFGRLWGTSDCRITRVVDGDTVSLQCESSNSVRGRLTRIDAPEMDGACASERIKARRAQWMLRWALWRGSEVRVLETGEIDRYDRALIDVFINGKNVNAKLIEAGVAVFYIADKPHEWC